MIGLLISLMAAALTVGSLGFVSAETARKPGEPSSKQRAAAKTASGIVKAFASDSLVVVGKASGRDTEWTFALDPKTMVKKRGRPATPGDLRTGDQVTVRYTEQDGKTFAHSIAVTTNQRKSRPSRRR